MESTGARLKKLRLEKGFSLEEVHKKTKIHLNILKAIEEDNIIGLSPIYTKGFLKIYCKFLGMEPKDYISGYQEPSNVGKVVSSEIKKPASFLRSVSIRLDSFRTQNIKIIKIIFIFILGLSLLVGLFALGVSITLRRPPQLKKAKLPIKTQSQITVPIKKEVSSTIKLIMRAKEDCWVNLKVDGRLVFRTVLKKGKFEGWQANDKIEFSLGNAGAVDLELNSRPIPALGRKGQVIKNVLITKEKGLIVPR